MKATLIKYDGPQVLDLHVLNYSGISVVELDRCLKSLIDQPNINVYLVENEGNMWEGRQFGYAQGIAPYVTYVDADDWVEQNMAAVIDELKLVKPKAMFTNAWHHRPDGTMYLADNRLEKYTREREYRGGPIPHQLSVYQRDFLYATHFKIQTERAALSHLIDWGCDLILKYEVSMQDAWHYFDVPVYHWAPQSHGALAQNSSRFTEIAQYYEHLRYAS